VLVVGAGQLGTALRHVMAVDPYWSAWPALTLDRAALDLCDAAAIEGCLTQVRPEIVINTAAYNRVDEAESQPALAFAVNASAPATLARAATRLGARFVQVSTDYVFSGESPASAEPARPYREDDLPAPCSVYGASKLAGEHLARAYASDALIVRTSGIYGARPAGTGKRSFAEAILAQLGALHPNAGGREAPPILRVVDDQRVSPTYAVDLALAILELVRRDVRGIVHATNAGSCTWFECAQAIVDLVGASATVVPVASGERPTAARRPAYSVLDHGRLRDLGMTMPPWRDALGRYLRERTAPSGTPATGVRMDENKNRQEDMGEGIGAERR
jgi:dTDP-4-dehydrorhamnose reductase